MSFTAGQILTAAALNALQSAVTPLYVRKTVEQSVLGSTTLVDDDELILAVTASTTYRVTGLLLVDGVSSGPQDIRVAWDAPTGSTLSIAVLGPYEGWTSTDRHGSWDAISSATTFPTTAQIRGCVSGQEQGLVVQGDLIVGVTAGSFLLEWAQGTSDGTNPTKVLEGSWLRLDPA